MPKPIVGPVLYYDALRSARRGRFVLLRTAYAAGLFGIFLLIFVDSPVMTSQKVAATDLSRYATNFFYGFLIFQFIFGALLTPSFVAGAIAEEKQRRTIEFLLTTDLCSREIVWSKLLSRVASLLLLLLTGLPVLSLVQLFGGVDPALLWSAFIATGVTILSIASLSILMSIYARKTQTAIGQATSVVLSYFVLYFALLIILELIRSHHIPSGFKASNVLLPWWYRILGFIVEIWGSGHPFHAIVNYTNLFLTGMKTSRLTSVSLADTRLQVLLNYCLFHGFLFLLFLVLSIWRLRPVSLSHAFAAVKSRPSKVARRAARRRPVTDRPMLWKVLHIEYQTSSWMSRVLFAVILFCCFSPVVLIIYYSLDFNNLYLSVSKSMSDYISIVAPLFYMLCVFTNATRAAASVGIERDNQTLDSLLVTPLKIEEILRAKWVGAWWGSRPLLALLAGCWLITLVCGGSSLAGCLLSWLVFVAYGSMGASVGLFFGARSTATSRASRTAAVVMIFLTGGYWFVLYPISAAIGTTESEMLSNLLVAATPWVSLGLLTMLGTEHSAFRTEENTILNAAGIFLSMLAASLVAWSLWHAAVAAFREKCGRLEPKAFPPPKPGQSRPPGGQYVANLFA